VNVETTFEEKRNRSAVELENEEEKLVIACHPMLNSLLSNSHIPPKPLFRMPTNPSTATTEREITSLTAFLRLKVIRFKVFNKCF